jgi:hypothetical protein
MSETQDNTQEQPQDAELSAALAAGDGEFVTAEAPKPAANQTLIIAMVLSLIGGGVYLLYKRQPAAAAASVETAQAQATINNFLTSGPSGIKAMEEMLHNTEKIVQQFLEYPSVPQIPLSALHTNPFRFAKAEPTAKSDEDAAKKKHEQEREVALKGSQALNLQSIIHSGARKACMINNTLVLEGQQIDQFVVEKISPGSVIVKSGVYRFELRMQK